MKSTFFLLTIFLTLAAQSLFLSVSKLNLKLHDRNFGGNAETTEYSPYGIAITGFTLVNADTDTDLFPLRDGGIINIDIHGSQKLTIRADEFEVQSGIVVDFEITGPINRVSREMVAPYSLFGDNSGNYAGNFFPEGVYSIKAASYSIDSSGNIFPINEILLQFIVGRELNEIIGVNLMDAEFDTDLDLSSKEYHIRNGQIFDSDNYPFYLNEPRQISIKATTDSYETGSVYFSLKGPVTYSRIENAEPFTLFGDKDSDFYGKIFPPGAYTLIITPYSQSNLSGKKGISKVINFTVADLPEIAIQEFAGFIQADYDTEVAYLSPYVSNQIYQGDIPTDNINIAVYPSYPDNGLSSVSLELEGPISYKRIENVAPFALFGDINGDYQGKSLPPGTYVLKATPYTGPNGSGLAGQGYSYDIEVLASSFNKSSVASQAGKEDLVFWPNPAFGANSITIKNGESPYSTIIYDLHGKIVREFSLPGNSSIPVDVSGLPKGYYPMRFTGSSRSFTKMLVIE